MDFIVFHEPAYKSSVNDALHKFTESASKGDWPVVIAP